MPERARVVTVTTSEAGAPAVKTTPEGDKPQVATTARTAEPEAADVLKDPVASTRTRAVVPKVVPRPLNGAARRYAPPTHSLIGSFEQAGFGLRYGAWMFDFLITLIAIMAFTFIVTAVSQRAVVNSNRNLVIVAVLTLLLFTLNFVVLAGTGGQSAGMRILGIHIARVDGRPFTMKDAALRHLVGYPLSTVAFFLGFLWMLWDPRQQGWHDKIARTIVVMSR
jgi:uncharacterized RDD family membrane protein YckC